MAAGDRKVKIQESRILRGVPILAQANWTHEIEEKATGTDRTTHHGHWTNFTLAPNLGAFNAMTGAQIRQAFVDAVAADPRVIALAPDSVT